MIPDQLGHYEILDLLGKGGMGEVYRARDTRLGRIVALKLLPEDIGRDQERLARFRREAKVLASLNHASIAAIHGLEEDQGKIFLVLELAEGEDLSDVFSRGPMPIDDVLNVARQLAEGLEQAHERGVVHRDLKPANVKLSEGGTLKILDFGLARAYAGESAAEGDLGASPTITAAMTQAGTILGTAAYMSPEQARGAEVDRRADIWAFGVILYELLTGRRLFLGDTISDTLAEVLKTEPEFDDLPENTPVALRWLVERCLQKRPSKRLRDIGEARILLESDLDHMPASTMSHPGVVVVERPRWVLPAILVAAAIALFLGFGVARWMGEDSGSEASIHATLLAPPGTRLQLSGGSHLSMSPDGTRVAFVAEDSTGVELIWVRRLDSSAAYTLSGTEGATYPFWSPDSAKVGFFANGRLKRIDAGGGVAAAVCDAPGGRGGTWLADGRIVFAPDVRDRLQLVASSGGTPLSVTEVDTLSWSHRWPAVLPGTDKFLYLSMGPDRTELRWRSIDGGEDEKVLLTDVLRATFGDGNLFYGRDGALWARPFDPAQGVFTSEEVLVAESVRGSSNFGSGAYTVSLGGMLVFAAGEATTRSMMAIFDREGNELDRFEFGNAFAQDPNLSPDGRYLALAQFPAEGGARSDVWIRDLQRGLLSRLTTDEDVDDPVWGPEGDRIIYSQQGHLFVRSTTGARQILWDLAFEQDAIPHDWSMDGRFILLTVPGVGRDILVVPTDDPAAFYPLVQNGHDNYHPAFSPDGRWVTYMSVESGEPRVYLRSFDVAGGTWPVSRGFGVQPRFSQAGTEIYYLGEDGLEVVSVEFAGGAPELSDDRSMFRVRLPGGGSNTHRYDVDSLGERFVMMVDPSPLRTESAALELVVNWRGRAGM